MANQEQLEILSQGVDYWNKWRRENPQVEINLLQANLREVDLRRINLTKANLTGVDLFEAQLNRSSLSGADLIGAHLTSANLTDADLTSANLMSSNLARANLTRTILTDARLELSSLLGTVLIRMSLERTNWLNTRIGSTVFVDIDLSKSINLEKIKHAGPSSLSENTLANFNGKPLETFLRGCGLPDWIIESAKFHNPELTNEELVKIQYRIYDLRATQAIQISPLFISYSHADKPFVDRLDAAFTQKGIRFWRDIHDASAGRLETIVDRAMRLNPTVLLILSGNSLESDWVEHEVRSARSLEKEMHKDVLCPVALDDSWKNSPWAKRIMEQIMEYNILDFSEWKDDSKFESIFNKLIDGLGLFYK